MSNTSYYYKQRVTKWNFPKLVQFKKGLKVGYSIRIWDWNQVGYRWLYKVNTTGGVYTWYSFEPDLNRHYEYFENEQQALAAFVLYQKGYDRVNTRPPAQSDAVQTKRVMRRVSP